MRTANSDWKSANQEHNELRIKLARFVSVQRRFARWQRSKGSCGVCETSKISSTQWSLFWNEAIWAFDVCNIKPRLWSSEPRTFCVCSNIKKRVVLIVCEPESSGNDENIAQRFIIIQHESEASDEGIQFSFSEVLFERQKRCIGTKKKVADSYRVGFFCVKVAADSLSSFNIYTTCCRVHRRGR